MTLVPTLRVGTHLLATLCVARADAERPGQRVPTQSMGTRRDNGHVGQA